MKQTFGNTPPKSGHCLVLCGVLLYCVVLFECLGVVPPRDPLHHHTYTYTYTYLLWKIPKRRFQTSFRNIDFLV